MISIKIQPLRTQIYLSVAELCLPSVHHFLYLYPVTSIFLEVLRLPLSLFSAHCHVSYTLLLFFILMPKDFTLDFLLQCKLLLPITKLRLFLAVA